MKHVFTFGCAKSGTTYLWKLMQQISGEQHVERIIETNPLHPINSESGLLGLALLFRTDHVIIRIHRDPIEIFEAYYALRQPQARNGLWHQNQDDIIFRYIENERRSVQLQKEAERNHPFNLEEIQYWEFEDAAAVAEKLEPYLPGRNIEEKIRETWMKEPSREGRLSMGITESLVPEEMKEEIRERCYPPNLPC